LDRGYSSTLECAKDPRGLEHDFIEFPDRVPHAGGGLREERMEVMHPRCAGLDVHKETVVA
jgi:hypothetical protein